MLTIFASVFVQAAENFSSNSFFPSLDVQSLVLKLGSCCAEWLANVASFAARCKSLLEYPSHVGPSKKLKHCVIRKRKTAQSTVDSKLLTAGWCLCGQYCIVYCLSREHYAYNSSVHPKRGDYMR